MKPQPVVWRGAVPNLRINAVDLTSFLDNLPAAIVSDYLGGDYKIEIYDASRRMLSGVLGAVGTGETLGSELVTNGDFTAWTGNDPDGFTMLGTEDASNYILQDPAGKCKIVRGTGLRYLQQSVYSISMALYKTTIDIDSLTYAVVLMSVWDDLFFTTGSFTRYGTQVASTQCGAYVSADSQATIDNLSAKQVTAPSAAGALILPVQGALLNSFTHKNASFTYNLASYTAIVRKLRG